MPQQVDIAPDWANISNYANGALTQTGANVKDTAGGQVIAIDIFNADAAAEVYLQVFGLTVANVTLGTTVPIWSMGVGPDDGRHIEFIRPLKCSAAISVFASSTRLGNGAPATALSVHVRFK